MTTMADVAREAGVSKATVSRVLNGRPVDPVLMVRVREAATRLGYRPNRFARSLRTNQGTSWMLIIPDIRNPFFTDVADAVEEVATEAGFSTVLCNAHEDVERENRYIELAIAERASGVLLSPTSTRTDVRRLLEAHIPIVTVDRRVDPHIVDHVVVDNVLGASAAVAHLAQNGYERIACIAGPLDTSTAKERVEGYRRGLDLASLKGSTELTCNRRWDEDGGYEAMRSLLDLPEPPDAVFIGNQLMAAGALRAIDQAGLTIPEDIAIVGFDETPWATLLRPPLTTVG